MAAQLSTLDRFLPVWIGLAMPIVLTVRIASQLIQIGVATGSAGACGSSGS